MATKQVTTWFVEAYGHTNEAIARELPNGLIHRGVMCEDGRKRDFWECEYSFITKLLLSEKAEHLQFKVWRREGRHGKVRRWVFLRRARLTLASALTKGKIRRGRAVATSRGAL